MDITLKNKQNDKLYPYTFIDNVYERPNEGTKNLKEILSDMRTEFAGNNYITITLSPTSTTGSVTQEQLTFLQSNKTNYILLNNEKFILQDIQTDAGYLIYSHIGQDNTHNFFVKCLTITISTLTFVITSRLIDYQSNPNLLINGDFRINQRGSNSYTGTTSGVYTVDRWKLYDNGGSFNANTKVLTINTPYYVFVQPIEDYEKLLGKTLTLSVKVKSISSGGAFRLYYRDTSQHDPSSPNITGAGIYSITFTPDSSSTQLQVGLRSTVANANIELEYIKLEIGSIATPFSPRPHAEELALCQRYFQKFKSQTLRCDLYTTTYALFTLPIPVSLRNYVTLTMGTGSGIQAITGGSVDTNWVFSTLTPIPDNCIKIKAVAPTGVTPMDCIVNFQATTLLDAEIY